MKLTLLLLPLLAACALDVEGEGLIGAPAQPPLNDISYSLLIQPIFDADCDHCHGGAGGLELTSYAGLLLGGLSGAAVIPGSPDNSLLIHRLEGTIGPRMPTDGPPLTQPEIDRIKQWILEGAKDN